jgi:hypothetical protein
MVELPPFTREETCEIAASELCVFMLELCKKYDLTYNEKISLLALQMQNDTWLQVNRERGTIAEWKPVASGG